MQHCRVLLHLHFLIILVLLLVFSESSLLHSLVAALSGSRRKSGQNLATAFGPTVLFTFHFLHMLNQFFPCHHKNSCDPPLRTTPLQIIPSPSCVCSRFSTRLQTPLDSEERAMRDSRNTSDAKACACVLYTRSFAILKDLRGIS